ncbi:TetR family transcriptional regulator [Planotetraspora thailandica]|uniref:TetR family transcriptional regulator n=1 Tax=Planotetraspora thailandica TaxID=487172 RepID=A0A8J3V672_9ACTN|nr:TetR/AcrR family transcriptional regulator [Planotetraspora thailandica]GII57701.1 TetR family transcriptional regulator [Planotetraspora thailandica]
MVNERIAALLWPEHERAKRGPKPRMTVARIVETAIAVADRDGLDGVSMQRIADELGATKMSLYRYTPGKAELMALMLDTAVGGPPEALREGWREGLTDWALALHDAFRRHPWALELAVGARVFGPNELDWMEAGLSALRDTALSGAERVDALVLVTGHVRSIVQQGAAPGSPEGPERGVDRLMAGIIMANAGRYPETLAAFASARTAGEQDQALTFGLDRILDGLGVAMTRSG